MHELNQDAMIGTPYILLRRRGHATPIVTVQISKFFSVTKNSNIAPVRTYASVPKLPIERVLKIVTLKNFNGCTSCMPSSPKEYISPWYTCTLPA